MLDPIGGFNRLREFFISYLETAYRIRGCRPDPGQAATPDRNRNAHCQSVPEPVPRYEAVSYGLEELATREGDNPIASLDKKSRTAFLELALSGLFPGKKAANGLGRRGDIRPTFIRCRCWDAACATGSPPS